MPSGVALTPYVEQKYQQLNFSPQRLKKTEPRVLQQMVLISRECSLYLTIKNGPDFVRYQSLSGLGFNKLGLYEECIQDPNNQFYLLRAKSDIFNQIDQSPDHTFMSGLCFNKICSAHDLQYVFNSLKQYVPKMPIKQLKIETPSSMQNNIDSITLAVIVLLSLFLAVFLVCSVLDFIRKSRKIKNKTHFIEIFSVRTTMAMIQSRSERNNERIKTFSGIKAISLAGIALINLGTIAYFAPTTSFYSQTQDQSIYALFYSVDVWLMTSGFFLSYTLLKQYQKHRNYITVLMKIVRRFLRLWPIYLFCLFINWNILPLTGSGPIWPILLNFPSKFCDTYFPHVFMVSNLFQDKCYNHLWLLSLDCQLCLIFVPLLIIFIKSQQSKIYQYLFNIIQLVLIISALLSGFYTSEDQAKSLTNYFFETQFYGWNIQPFVRYGGYTIGYNLGIIYFIFKKTPNKQNFWLIKILNRKLNRILFPLIGFVGIFGIVLSFESLKDVKMNREIYLYFASLRTIFPVFITLIILPSLFGYISSIKSFLESWTCNIISKLSISLYGIHYCIGLYIIYCRQFDLELSNFTVIFLTFCTVIPTVVISIVLTSIIQIPLFVCKKVYLKTERITYFEH